ncbi:unnamed protein product [Microthlaspi erraticum]|uniref:F-box associated beta-propeller type 1 domain-containing protein n=1 Tax=Microthlaspi erraticum TaxID=1685480 RepID=A0A6D2IX80_9BRAS|nr:unnamed protein product [Microthlaspi erraticum]
MLIDSRVYVASFDLHGTDENIVKVTRQFSLKDSLSNPSKEVDIIEVFHCDGFLLCITKDNMLVVWNPCSGETKWMIKPEASYKNYCFYALGKSSCNKYKILRVDQHGIGFYHQSLVEFEIYDFTSNSWRSVGNTRDWAIQGLHRRGMSVNGNTYWIAFNFSHQATPMRRKFLLSFDFSTERFASVPLPFDPSHERVMALSVTREEQKLCLLASRGKEGYDEFDIDVWMATKIESTGAMSWSKFITVEEAVYRQLFYFCNGMNFLADTEKKVLVCPGTHGNSKKFLHIVGDDKCIQVDGQEYEGSLLVNYVPTLVQIEQGTLGVGARKAPIT